MNDAATPRTHAPAQPRRAAAPDVDARAKLRARLARLAFDARRANPDAHRLALSSIERILADKATPEFLDPIVVAVLGIVAEDAELLAVVRSLAMVYTLEVDPADVLGKLRHAEASPL